MGLLIGVILYSLLILVALSFVSMCAYWMGHTEGMTMGAEYMTMRYRNEGLLRPEKKRKDGD